MNVLTLTESRHFLNKAAANDLLGLIHHLERLEASRNALLCNVRCLEEMAIRLVSRSRLEVLFMLKNKLGLTKEQAKNIYFRFRNGGGEEENASPQQSKDPETNEEKIAMIMDYMKDTSAKLDQIESDIAYLKKQVDQILKRL